MTETQCGVKCGARSAHGEVCALEAGHAEHGGGGHFNADGTIGWGFEAPTSFTHQELMYALTVARSGIRTVSKRLATEVEASSSAGVLLGTLIVLACTLDISIHLAESLLKNGFWRRSQPAANTGEAASQ